MGTKERILLSALKLFSKNGYASVSVSEIANELGITKGALYKHYKNKRDIFETIVKRMEQLDYERAKEFSMPELPFEESISAYESVSILALKTFTYEQFKYWTENEFASEFRKMLLIEQYKDKTMEKLYQQYLVGGVIDYIKHIFENSEKKKEKEINFELLALQFYSPILVLMNCYDICENKEQIINLVREHLSNF